MYRKILVALDHSWADASLLPHVSQLARLTDAELVLVHVAEGWAARWGEQFNLADSREMQEDAAYLEEVAGRLRSDGLSVRAIAGRGEPYREILKVAREAGCDLIAMTTHGHRFVYDLLIGSTIDKVRHGSEIPLLIVRAAARKNRGE
jgi:manganese transport protein